MIRRGQAGTERPCGAPATIESGQTRCPECRFREDGQAFGVSLAADRALRRAYGVPDHIFNVRRFYSGEALFSLPQHHDARVEIFAFQLPATPGPVLWPWTYDEFPGIGGPCVIARWRFRIPGRPGVLEVTWDRRRTRDERFSRSLIIDGLGVSPEHVLALWRLYIPKAEEDAAALVGLKARRSRDHDLSQAVRAARAMLHGDPPQHPAMWRIAEAIADEEGTTLTESGLTSRWQRHKDYGERSITIAEVLQLARQP
jgi:hypothetical protein